MGHKTKKLENPSYCTCLTYMKYMKTDRISRFVLIILQGNVAYSLQLVFGE